MKVGVMVCLMPTGVPWWRWISCKVVPVLSPGSREGDTACNSHYCDCQEYTRYVKGARNCTAADTTLQNLAEETGASLLSLKLWKSSGLNHLPATAPFTGHSLLLLKCQILLLKFEVTYCLFCLPLKFIIFCVHHLFIQQLKKADLNAALVCHCYFKGSSGVLHLSHASFRFLWSIMNLWRITCTHQI